VKATRDADHANPSAATTTLPILGWREWLGLPELGLPVIRAKVDTGARTSALHVEYSEVEQRDGVEWVRFGLRPKRHARVRDCLARVIDHREVTDSSGKRTQRVFISTELQIGALRYPIELNLTRRHEMLFPMLLGRTALAGWWMIDPAGSFLQGRPRRRREASRDPVI
jgi:hypothetical protein